MADALPQGWWSQESDPAIQNLVYQAANGKLAPSAAYQVLSQVSQPRYKFNPSYNPAAYASQAKQALAGLTPNGGLDPSTYNALVASGATLTPQEQAAGTAFSTGAQADPAAMQALLSKYPTQAPPDKFSIMDILPELSIIAGGLTAAFTAPAAAAASGAASGADAAAAGGTAASGAAAAPAAAGAGASLADFATPAELAASSPAELAATLEATPAAFSAAPAGVLAASSPAELGAALEATPVATSAPTSLADLSGAAAAGSSSLDNSLLTQAVTPSPTTAVTSPLTEGGVPTSSVSDAANPAILNASSPAQLDQALQGIQPPSFATSTPLDWTANNLSSTLNGTPVSGPPASVPSSSIFDSTVNGFNKVEALMKAHPLLTNIGGLAAGQLLSPVLSGAQGPTSGEKALLNNAQSAIDAQNKLIGSEASGVLPPGAETQIQNALNADIANIKQRYAQMGMSGSSAESQDIANAQNQAASQRFQFAQQATNTGANLAGINNQVYETLLQAQLNRQQALSNAFTRLMSSIGTATALSH